MDALRNRAFRAYGRTHFQECLDLLDQAKALDPDGDDDPAVQSFRIGSQRAVAKSDGG